MFEHLSLPILSLVFAVAAAVVWLAGVYISKTTDVLSSRFGLGEALGGLILLAIVTNLPEIAIAILTLAVMGHQLPGSLIWHGITPDDVLICGIWIAGIYLIGKARQVLPWQSHGNAPRRQRLYFSTPRWLH